MIEDVARPAAEDSATRNRFSVRTLSGALARPLGGGALRDRLSQQQWRRVRRVLGYCYFLALAALVVTEGVPTGRTELMTIIIVGLLITSLGRGWRALLQVILDWLPFTIVLVVYDMSRGLAHAVGLPLHETDVADAEKWLFGGTVPTVWLQDHFYSPTSVHWYDAAATLVYTSHFLATPILAAVLWLRNRQWWLSYITRVVVLSVAALITYVLFPEAPPWMAAHDHVIAPVARLSARGWIYLHAPDIHEALANAQNGGSNPTAAMPSLHTAWATLVALTIAGRVRSRLRYVLVLYPMAMGLALVYLGEHYVLDVLAGVAYALAVNWLVGRWERAHRAGSPPGEISNTADPPPRNALSAEAFDAPASSLRPRPGDEVSTRQPAQAHSSPVESVESPS